MIRRGLLLIMLVVPLLTPGCVIQMPDDGGRDDGSGGWFTALSTNTWSEQIEITRETFDLGAANGFAHSFDVEVPEGATHMRVGAEHSGSYINFEHEGLGACARRTSTTINIIGSGTMISSCDHPASGPHTVTARMDGGQATFTFVVVVTVEHVDAQ